MERIAAPLPMAEAGPVIHLPITPATLADDCTNTLDLHVLAHGDVPDVPAAEWALEVCGLIQTAISLTFADLLDLPQRELVSVHQCAGNPLDPTVPARQVANVTWRGVDLLDVLALTGVRPEAALLWAWGLDGGNFVGRSFVHYLKDIPLERVNEGDVILAHALNGEPLSVRNGFPVRLVVPGYYGTNSVKWLCRLELADHRPESLFTTELYNDPVAGGGTRPVREIAPESIIYWPEPDATIDAGSVTIRGRAWGSDEIVAVGVSVDGGATWHEAQLGKRHERGWHGFTFDWRASGGDHVLQCRATAITGDTQPADGARNAIYSANVTVI
ncbi:molybdopterin-dependent oxidoreductase [Altererythrobacter salegens]|uniref:Molybdopterin-dependent oxidoreductase n=1 Tax=Croceibacterium salegens TaxID=1737568 RepID=A0A6I4T0R6_9SPHN|nr:molybdopterin-dependent oxidoreductase [Croceibacterium salegens]MXO60847.1 molybdopterin-dependent oxidoreductase [Croceibacterium salegens]